MSDTQNFSIMAHGGAGALDNVSDDRTAIRYLEAVRRILEHGREVMELGGSALQAVEACASLLEDDPVFNAGCGSVLNEEGKVEMDAAIMDGRDLSAGAVAAISGIANPIQLARLVMTKSEHVMLTGEGAMRFADHCGVARAPEGYFLTPERVAQFEEAKKKHKIMLDHDRSDEASEDQKYGTIGVVARDWLGNLAAATSTGGIVNKRLGRIGDSPIVGAGVYADNETCAVSATGYGEDFMRTVISKTISDFMLMKGMNAREATDAGIDYMQRKLGGRGGVIVIDKDGNCASGFTTSKMIHGWIEKGGETVVRF
jgi:beta-aspartyl-peptidase (threonine type)